MLQKIRSIITDRDISKYNKIITKINALEDTFAVLSDEQLRQKTIEFQNRLFNGAALDSLLVEAFAVAKEASARVLNQKAYDVQLLTGIVLHYGDIAEMKTGEGKTLSSVAPIYLNALLNKGVHVVTANDYLAKRDSIEMGKVFEFLGLTVGLIHSELDKEDKKKAYQSHVVYGTSSEFGFDYLRDNMVKSLDKKVQRPLHFAVIDEADSILIDEARTPLVISSKVAIDNQLYEFANHFVQQLKLKEDYVVDYEENVISLTNEGISKAEKDFGIDNLFSNEHTILNHHIQIALQANYLMEIDVDYVVNDGEVIIIDSNTGRLMNGRRFNDGLHQAIEVKENIEVQEDSISLATITIQNYFRMYEKLSGMTGTAKTEEHEFVDIYGMKVVVIPTNIPSQRIDKADLIYSTKEEKYKAILSDILEKHKIGQPILVGTPDIETSEKLSFMLQKQGILHYVLNANNHEYEAHIISKAGLKDSITIATNMAGRGTDIKPGDNVDVLGGLYVIGVEKNDARRVDNQLRGRTGRQGMKGTTQFYVSLEDSILKKLGTKYIEKTIGSLSFDSEETIENPLIFKIIEDAQQKIESNNYNARKHLLQLDNVLNEQREIFYNQRVTTLKSNDLDMTLDNMISNLVKESLQNSFNIETDEYDYQDLLSYLDVFLCDENKLLINDIVEKSLKEIEETLYYNISRSLKQVKNTFSAEEFLDTAKYIILDIADRLWVDHINNMEHLRQGIHLRGYGEKDPYREYKVEGFNLFNQFIADIEKSVLATIINFKK